MNFFINILSFAEAVLTPTVVIRMILAIMMLVAGIASAVLVLFQSSNSDATSAISGGKNNDSSDTFYGRNKGNRREYKLKVWTFISSGVLAVCSIVFFLLAL